MLRVLLTVRPPTVELAIAGLWPQDLLFRVQPGAVHETGFFQPDHFDGSARSVAVDSAIAAEPGGRRMCRWVPRLQRWGRLTDVGRWGSPALLQQHGSGHWRQ